MRGRVVRQPLGCALGLLVACAVGLAPAHASSLPDGRAFELVSPSDTGGAAALQQGFNATVPLSDDAVIYGGGYEPSGPSGSGSNPYYVAQRTAAGWTSTSLLPANISGGEVWQLKDADANLSAAVFNVGPVDLDSGEPAPGQQVPNRLVYRDSGGNFDTIQSIPYAEQRNGAGFNYAGMSSDGQTVLFTSNVTPAGTSTPGGAQVAYAWQPGGVPQAIAGEPGDALAGCGVNPVLMPQDVLPGGVSSDGSTVFLMSGGGGGANCPANPQLFASIDGHSQEVSVSTDGTVAPPGPPPQFIGATPDGRTAYFVDYQPLTASAAAGGTNVEQLYEWTVGPGGSDPSVTCVSCSADGDTQTVDDPGTTASAEGDYVYFTFTNPSPNATGSDAQELDVFHDGVVQTVDADAHGYQPGAASFQISPAGNVVVFERIPGGALTQLGFPGNAYHAVVGAAGVSIPECITCVTAGAETSQDFGVSGDYLAPTVGLSGDDAISADGDAVVFQTDNALGAADLGSSFQVWEWTATGGDQFIADGYSYGSSAGNAAITPDGQDIFFYSPDALTFDGQPDVPSLYDARVGGGFAPPPPAASCSGDACQGASAGASPPTGVASAGAGSGGNASGAFAPAVTPLPLSAAAVRSAERNGRLVVRVKVRGGGRLRVTATLMTGSRRRGLASATRQLHNRGTRTFSVALHVPAGERRELVGATRSALLVEASLTGARPVTRRLELGARSTRSRPGGHS